MSQQVPDLDPTRRPRGELREPADGGVFQVQHPLLHQLHGHRGDGQGLGQGRKIEEGVQLGPPICFMDDRLPIHRG